MHRTAVLRHDELGAETLLNLLLRSYLADNLYDQVGGQLGQFGYLVLSLRYLQVLLRSYLADNLYDQVGGQPG